MLSKELFKNSVKGFLISLGSGIVLILILGYICYTRHDPDALIAPLGLTALYLSALAGGIAAARFNKTDGLLSGAVSGLCFMLFIILMALFMRDGESGVGLITWLLYLLTVIVSAVGGRFGVHNKRKKKKILKKRR